MTKALLDFLPVVLIVFPCGILPESRDEPAHTAPNPSFGYNEAIIILIEVTVYLSIRMTKVLCQNSAFRNFN